MTVQVLDSHDLPAILADAGVVLDPAPQGAQGAADAAAGGEPAAAGAESPRAAAPGEGPKEEGPRAGQQPPEDEEDENGLTAEQRQELTAKMQKAIGKKHRALREAEEFAAAQFNTAQLAQRRAQELEAELARMRGAKGQAAPEAPQAPAKPDRKDFASEGEFLDAMIQWGVDQRLAQERERQAREAAEREQREVIEAATKRIATAREAVPDFDEVLASADAEVPPAVAGYMQRSEMIAELGYHFAKNPEVLVSLSKLRPDEQLVKIGRIESTLQPFAPASAPARHDTQSSQQQTHGQPRSAAPSETTGSVPSKARGNAAPVFTPLDGTGSAGTAKDSADMNIRESIQDWSRRNHANLGMRKRH